MKMITAELTGLSLDYALARAEGKEFSIADNLCGEKRVWLHGGTWAYMHTDPNIYTELMNEHKMDVTWGCSGKCYVQPSGNADFAWIGGETLPEAVARCVVAMRLGDEVDVPDELVGVQS
jgi:hypothetical protein